MELEPSDPNSPRGSGPDATSARREPSLSPPPFVLNRHGGRVLDAANAVRLKGETIRSTLYVGSNLLVRKSDWDGDEKLKRAVIDAADLAGLKVTDEDTDPDLGRVAARHKLNDLADRLRMVRLVLEPKDPTMAAAPPDAWQVLQNYRASVSPAERKRDRVTLDHLMTSGDLTGTPFMGTPFMGTPFMGTPFMGTPFMGTPFMGTASPSAEYGVAGRGGRAPVAWLGPEPRFRSDKELGCRRPVVAILDTGAGEHWWLDDKIVDRHPSVDGGSLRIGLHEGPYYADRHGAVNNPLEGVLDSDAGHGTFIAGLIRQTCPDAKILAIAVMRGDGTVPESSFLKSLNRLVLRQAIAVAENKPKMLVDVVSLSLGYYHELPSDYAMDHKILTPIRELGKLGVVTVAAAGNDATTRHFYPAGFAPHRGSKLGAKYECVPLISVGSVNPDSRVESLFSNAGTWVTTWRPGASLVSTFPTDFDGSLQPTASLYVPQRGKLVRRSTIDPDNFRSGFATWSGTSFAAPVLAGQIAEALRCSGSIDKTGIAAAADRAWQAITSLAGLKRPKPGVPGK